MKTITKKDLILENNEIIGVNPNVLVIINEVKELFVNNSMVNGGIVFFTGAGVSTSSGIPDFKSQEENWEDNGFELTRSEVFSLPFFREQPERFWEIYRENFKLNTIKPTIFHRFADSFGNKARVITQNIDSLHNGYHFVNKYNENESNLIEMHGNSERVICLHCDLWGNSDNFFNEDSSEYSVDSDNNGRNENNKYMLKDYAEISPKCKQCGNFLKPDISLFFEGVNGFSIARDWIVDCRLLIVAGCSLRVGPANELPLYLNWGRYAIDLAGNEVYSGEKVAKSIWVNRVPPPADYSFDYEFIMESDEFAQLFDF